MLNCADETVLEEECSGLGRFSVVVAEADFARQYAAPLCSRGSSANNRNLRIFILRNAVAQQKMAVLYKKSG